MRRPAPHRIWSPRLLAALLVGVLFLPDVAAAQRPFRTSDPFYRNETARRDFFDRYALTGEVAYRSSSAAQEEGVVASSDLAFRVSLDYELFSRLDLGAIFESVGGDAGRSVGLSWLLLKYYHHLETSDYAFRVAVDPSSGGQVGFPQVDFAFLYTSLFTPLISSDFALGLRRVNLGFVQFLPATPLSSEGPFYVRPQPSLQFTRALGTELHVMLNYNLHFDPAGSNIYFGLLGEGSRYDVIETEARQGEGGELIPITNAEALDRGDEATAETRIPFRGGVIWARGGLEFNRPSYQIAPFLAVPLQQWQPEGERTWPQARLHVGLQMMLR